MTAPMAGAWDWPKTVTRSLLPSVFDMYVSSQRGKVGKEAGIGLVRRFRAQNGHGAMTGGGEYGGAHHHAVVAAAVHSCRP